jgi:putative nucleotidyltransferase with HDIG domain
MRGTSTEADATRAPREDPFDDDERRWRRRPVLSRLLQGSVLVVPILAAVAVAAGVAAVLPSGDGGGRVGWWMVVLGVALLALVLLESPARRLLPLAALLRLTLLFPDRAPSRFRVALRGTSRARLETWAGREKRSGGPGDGGAGERARQILSLAAALHAHDRMTRGHSERVRALTELVAEELRLTDDEADRLQWAALLHDIGKLSVPAEILNKPGKPDAAEWAVLQRHPVEGARLAEPLQPWLGEWADAVAQHHEHFDGTGYPEGLAGEHISLAGRIVSVTDAFETMTAVRSYKRQMSAGAARAELARCAGTHFDPRVVRAFLGVSLGRLHWPAGGALAWVAAFPPVGALAQVGTRASAALARPAMATKTTAAISVIVLGGLLAAQSNVVTPGTGRPVAIHESADGGSAVSSTAGDQPEAVSAVYPAEPPAAASGVPADADAASGAAPSAGSPPAARPVTSPASAPPPGATPAPVGGEPVAGPPSPSPSPSPSESSPPPPSGGAAPGSPPLGAQIGPIEITLLPAPGVQVGDLTLLP